ncbi:MAG: glycosyltransferase [Parcubacteria group bacterium]|nr:glycosyltransferase [Parcubacteria group bacterium]
MEAMKVAIVHDYLNQYGGMERVLESFLQIFPDADLYALFYDEKGTAGRFSNHVVKTSFLNFLPFVKQNHRLFIPLMPSAAALINLGDRYDLLISNTAGYAKGVRYDSKKTFHASYAHTPLRYAWEKENYLDTHRHFRSRVFKAVSRPLLNYLRRWDFAAAQKPDLILTNSNHIRLKIEKYYNRSAVVINPPVDDEKFFYDSSLERGDYFLAAGRLMHYKRFDLIIEAFNELRLPLKIVGRGPELARLREAAESDLIEFIPFVEDDELRRLYARARAFIFPQMEDYGMVAAEAIACGTPVIAYRGGGATEIVKDGVSGTFFNEQSARSLKDGVERIGKMKFDPRKTSESVSDRGKEKFKKTVAEIIFDRFKKRNENSR